MDAQHIVHQTPLKYLGHLPYLKLFIGSKPMKKKNREYGRMNNSCIDF